LGENHWNIYHQHWAKIEAPLRPTPAVIDQLRAVAGDEGTVLVLGVTPEIVGAFSRVVAVDHNPGMIASLWPGNTPTKQAFCQEWSTLRQDGPRGISAIIGDGSLNAFSTLPVMKAALQGFYEILEPGGHFLCRMFERPAIAWQRQDLEQTMQAPSDLNFHAFKWMLAMYLCEQIGASIPVSLIRQEFNRICPDRNALARSTGWSLESINTIDVYEGSLEKYIFPNRSEIMACLPDTVRDVNFYSVGGYPLADCCPILSFRK
jgi:SAM-dependent methyltransferase